VVGRTAYSLGLLASTRLILDSTSDSPRGYCLDLGSLAYITMTDKLTTGAISGSVSGDDDYIQDFNEAASAAMARAHEEHLEMEESDREALDRDYRAYELARRCWVEHHAQVREKMSLLREALERAGSRVAVGKLEMRQVESVLALFVGEGSAKALCAGVECPATWSAFYGVADYLQCFCEADGAEVVDCATRKSGEFDAPVGGGSAAPHPFLGSVRPRKVYCERCGCYVNPTGHAGRCAPVVAVDPSRRSMMRGLAWLGDAAHHMDVRRHLLLTDVPDGELETRAQLYVSREAQAAYFSRVPDPEYPAVGKSVDARSAAFEANYFGAFRQSYLCEVLREDVSYSVPPYLRVYISGFPFSAVP